MAQYSIESLSRKLNVSHGASVPPLRNNSRCGARVRPLLARTVGNERAGGETHREERNEWKGINVHEVRHRSKESKGEERRSENEEEKGKVEGLS